MQALRISVVDFWWGNDDRDAAAGFVRRNRLCRGLTDLGFTLNLVFPASPAADPGLVIFGPFGSMFGDSHPPAAYPDAVKVFFCDENVHGFPEFSRYVDFRDRYDFSFTYDHTTPTNFRMTGLRALPDLPDLQAGARGPIPPVQGREFACFLYSHGTGTDPGREPDGVRLRNDFFTRLNARRRVNSGGAVMNNIGGRVPAEQTGAFVSRHKFILAMENSIQPGYVTEKILLGFKHHAVPVYCGAPDIRLDFDHRTFLHYTGDNFDDVVDEMIRLDADDAALEAMLRRPKLADPPRSEFSSDSLDRRVRLVAEALRVP